MDEVMQDFSAVLDKLDKKLGESASDADKKLVELGHESLRLGMLGDVPGQLAVLYQLQLYGSESKKKDVQTAVYRQSFLLGTGVPIVMGEVPEEHIKAFDALVDETGSVAAALERIFALAFNVLEEE